VNGIFESHRGLVQSAEEGENRMGLTVCGTRGNLTIRYCGRRELRICRDFPVPVEDNSHYEVVKVPEPEAIPGATPIDYGRWGVNPEVFSQVYFAENNRRAAWELLQAIREGREPQAGILSAIDSLEMIVGIYQSSILQKPVTFQLQNRQHPLTGVK
jgi:hypothetical protein